MDYMSQLSVTVSFSNFLHKFMSFRERERERERWWWWWWRTWYGLCKTWPAYSL